MRVNYDVMFLSMLSVFSTSVLPISVLLIGIISISEGGIEEAVVLSAVTAVSAIITTWFQNSLGLSGRTVTLSLYRKLIIIGFIGFLLILIRYSIAGSYSTEIGAIVAGVIYGIGCSVYNLFNRMMVKYFTASRIAWFVVSTVFLLSVILVYNFKSVNFVTNSFVTIGFVLFLVSLVGLTVISHLSGSFKVQNRTVRVTCKDIRFGMVSSFRLNSLVIVSLFFASPAALPEMTFALFVMRPLSLVFSIIAPLVYRSMDSSVIPDTLKYKYFLTISSFYTSVVVISTNSDLFGASGIVTAHFYISIGLIFAQVNLGFVRNLIEYRALQGGRAVYLLRGAEKGVLALGIGILVLIYMNWDVYLLAALLVSEIIYFRHIRLIQK